MSKRELKKLERAYIACRDVIDYETRDIATTSPLAVHMWGWAMFRENKFYDVLSEVSEILARVHSARFARQRRMRDALMAFRIALTRYVALTRYTRQSWAYRTFQIVRQYLEMGQSSLRTDIQHWLYLKPDALRDIATDAENCVAAMSYGDLLHHNSAWLEVWHHGDGRRIVLHDDYYNGNWTDKHGERIYFPRHDDIPF